MKPRILTLIVVGLGLLLSGCKQVSPGPVSGVADQAIPSTPKLEVPEELKNDAYHYYGLASTTPLKLEMSGSGVMSGTGTQTIQLKSVADGKAVFEVERTGSLEEQLGSDTVSLEKTGVYTIKSTRITSDKLHNLELPASLTPGATWTNSGSFTQAGDVKISQNLNIKAIGPQRITTKVGPEDAFLVSSTGTMSTGGGKFHVEQKMWFVKDKGLVKMVAVVKNASDPKAKPSTVTLQETK